MEGPFTGSTLGVYTLGRLLGQGGCGSVYEGRDAAGRRVAVKIIHIDPEDPRADELVSRFFLEARAVNLIDHPGIVAILDVDRMADGTRYLVMELVEGDTLSSRVMDLVRQVGAPPLAWALSVVEQVASILHVVHARRISHRDLKPENVMLVRDAAGGERVKLLDFGVAQLLDTDERLTTEGRALGTPYYMAPEQCKGEKQLDEKVDSYALGVMLFELVSGRLPFDGPVHAVMFKHIQLPPPTLREIAPTAPPWLDLLVGEMMSKDPKARPAMDEVVRRVRGRA